MEEGTIAKWHVAEGEHLAAGDLMLEVSTDKATVEYNALDEGWLRKILVKEGGEASVNQPIAIFTASKDESIEGYQPEGLLPKAKEVKEAVAASSPSSSEGQKNEEEMAAPAAKQPSIKLSGFQPEAPLAQYKLQRPSSEPGRLKASPLARKLARQKGLDLSTVKGSGPGGRIISQDLAMAQPSSIAAFGRREFPTIAPGTYEELSMSPMRKVIAQRLQEAKMTIPHFYVSMKVNAEPIMQLREQLKNHDIKVTVNDFIIRATALALRKHPEVNSGFNASSNSIIRFKTIDISIAVSVQGGLITPIVRHADYKNLGEISLEVKALAAKAKEGKLDPQEYKGGSFTLSNLGMYGVSDFIAIINPPQAAILAISGIIQGAAVRSGQLVATQEMTLSLSGDHRVFDGVAGAEFLRTLQKLLENPAVLLI